MCALNLMDSTLARKLFRCSCKWGLQCFEIWKYFDDLANLPGRHMNPCGMHIIYFAENKHDFVSHDIVCNTIKIEYGMQQPGSHQNQHMFNTLFKIWKLPHMCCHPIVNTHVYIKCNCISEFLGLRKSNIFKKYTPLRFTLHAETHEVVRIWLNTCTLQVMLISQMCCIIASIEQNNECESS